MKRIGKPVFFIVAILIVAFTSLSFFGISNYYGDTKNIYIKGAGDIRWGIDIRGGVDVTFTPPSSLKDVSKEDMQKAETTIKQRLVSLNITDNEVYTDYDKHRIIVRFPWKEGESNFNPEDAIKELGETAELTFREGTEQTGAVILTGDNVVKAEAAVQNTDTGGVQQVVSLEFDSEGTKKFSAATARQAAQKGAISIWMDDTLISAPSVSKQITESTCIIEGNFTAESAKELADKITAGALPFKLETENYNAITPTLGLGARDAMLLSGIIAFVLVCIIMIVLYRLPGVVASIGLLGQVGGMIAAVHGFLPMVPSFTLTLPGIAGIILSIGIGVDANVIISERIKEEINNGKSIDSAIDTGFHRGFSAVLDGNVTNVIVAVILMGAFGPPNTFFNTLLKPIFFMFGPSTAGAIYSFGYTLLVGVIFNFIMGVFCSRVMLKSLSRFKCFRKPAFYGGAKQ